ncbi:MAG: hypothetical protein JNK30_09860 [Phenylobacterium sp.]|uniref:hypothetical protein n=1 Tax=Phenylobacterium sp. TaxID=1871053 RepID=UPI001A428340|nr:hypothetical protein [Phenylobacterium sp.]MBL8771674.1 hypothetical protein [Phenylobacterium sp.]
MSGHLLYLALQAFSVFAGIFAFWKGGAAERLAAGVVIVNVAVGYLAGRHLADLGEVVRLGNDGLAALALLAITLRFGAPWMGGAMLFYAAQFALHSYLIVMERPVDYWIALINNINWNGVVWCLIIGTATSWRARVRRARARSTQLAQQEAA